MLKDVAARAGETRIFLGVYHPGSATTPLTADARAQFASYVAAIVRDVPSIRDVIVGNEPNLNRFWLPQFDEAGNDVGRAGLFRAARRGVRRRQGGRRGGPDLGRRARPARDRPARHGPRHPLADDVHPRPRRRLPRERPRRPAARRLRLPSVPGELEHPARPPHRPRVEVDPDGRLRGEAATAARRGVRARPARPLQRARRRDGDPAGQGVRSTRATEPGKPVDEATQADYYRRAIELASCQENVAGLLLFHSHDEPALTGFQSGVYYVDGIAEGEPRARARRDPRAPGAEYDVRHERAAPDRPVRRILLPQGRPRLAPAPGRGARGDEGRLRRRGRELERPLRAPAHLLDGRRPARLRLLPLEDHRALRRPGRARRRAQRHAAGRLARDAVLLPGDDEGVSVHRSAAAAEDHPEGLAVPRRLPVREGAAVVCAAARGPEARDGRAHPRSAASSRRSTTTRRTRSGSTTRSS